MTTRQGCPHAPPPHDLAGRPAVDSPGVDTCGVQTPPLRDPAIPAPEALFQPLLGPRGLRLALIFGNEAPHGKCPFHQKECVHCELGAGEGLRFTPELNRARLTFFQQQYKSDWPKVAHLILYNSGSTLNPAELSRKTLGTILTWATGLPALRRVSLDSRDVFVTGKQVAFLLDTLPPACQVAFTLGLESQSEEVRIGKLAKGITRAGVERLFRTLAGKERAVVELNVLFQPPGLTGQPAVDEALATFRYGLDLGERHRVPVDFNFHPYYPTWKGTLEFPDHPRAIVEDTVRTLILASRLVRERNATSSIFVGWNDEGHNLQDGARHRELSLYLPSLAAFNHSQDERDLRL